MHSPPPPGPSHISSMRRVRCAGGALVELKCVCVREGESVFSASCTKYFKRCVHTIPAVLNLK